MKNVICIDLTKFNNEKLVELANEMGISSESLLSNKKEGFVKLFIEGGEVIAYTTKKDKKTIRYKKSLDDMLSSIEPFELEETKDLTVDNILDKISKNGIESLSKTEREFLDKYNM